MPTVRVKFSVAPSGDVTKSVATGTMKGTPEGTCAAEAVEKLRFPRTREGIEDVEWKLPLSP